MGFSGGAREPVPQALKRFMQDLLGFADRVRFLPISMFLPG